MGDTTNISWANRTGSPYLGCSEVDACCVNCYAREWTRRQFAKLMREAYRKAGYEEWETMPVWGPKSPRVKTQGFWRDCLRWNREAEGKTGLERPRVFTSLDDWLDEMPAGAVDQFGHRLTRLELIAEFVHHIWQCQNLTWLTLTKRLERWRPTMLEILELYGKASCNDSFCAWLENWLNGDAPRNVWFGYTAGTRETWVERARLAWDIPAVVTWCSAEPLLEELFFFGNSDDLVEIGD